MLKALYRLIGYETETMHHTIQDANYEIDYITHGKKIEGDIIIRDRGREYMVITMKNQCITSMSINDYHYTFASDMTLTCLRQGNEVIFQHRLGAHLNGDIVCNGITIHYRNGEIMSTDLEGRNYRRIIDPKYPLYLIYSSEGICGYLQGLRVDVVNGINGYALIAGGYIIGYMNILDPSTTVQWRYNISNIISSIEGYNPCGKLNLLPWHYFSNEIWEMLLDNKIHLSYNEGLVSNIKAPPNYILLKDLYLRYGEDGSVIELYGYQPQLELLGGNLHGLLVLDREYFFQHGICQWIREGNLYWVKYTDNYIIKMKIFSDCATVVEHHNKIFRFNDEQLDATYTDSSGEIITLKITKHEGIPYITTYGRIRNRIR